MTRPALFSSASGIFSKKAKALLIDKLLRRLKNIIGSPWAPHWRKELVTRLRFSKILMVSPQKHRVMSTHIWDAKKGPHSCLFCHRYFLSFLTIEKPHVLQEWMGVCARSTEERNFCISGQKGPLKHSLKRILIHILVVHYLKISYISHILLEFML